MLAAKPGLAGGLRQAFSFAVLVVRQYDVEHHCPEPEGPAKGDSRKVTHQCCRGGRLILYQGMVAKDSGHKEIEGKGQDNMDDVVVWFEEFHASGFSFLIRGRGVGFFAHGYSGLG